VQEALVNVDAIYRVDLGSLRANAHYEFTVVVRPHYLYDGTSPSTLVLTYRRPRRHARTRWPWLLGATFVLFNRETNEPAAIVRLLERAQADVHSASGYVRVHVVEQRFTAAAAGIRDALVAPPRR